MWKDDILTEQQKKELSRCLYIVQTLSYKKDKFGLTDEQNNQYEKYKKRQRQLLLILRKYNEQ